VQELQAALGVEVDAELLERALTHRSYAYENDGCPHNERLEFLGDVVLSLVITESLFTDHPELPEGQLAKMRASLVNMRALAGVARGLGPDGLGAYLRLGRGEEATGGRDKTSILADALEAVLGAVHVDLGIEVATQVVHRLFDPLMENMSERSEAADWKTSLQELVASLGQGSPSYELTGSGPAHRRLFEAVVSVGGEPLGNGTGRSKKEAEQQAAAQAWSALRLRAGSDHPASLDGDG
jgi:ribonuclease-3